MKIFFRILSYANKLRTRLVFFFLYSFLGAIFGAFNIVLIIPMLSVLFRKDKEQIEIPTIPEFSFSTDYFQGLFDHYFLSNIKNNGQISALLFVCTLIIITVLLANIFKFLERVIATKIKVDLTKNI
ncbi:MAG TPA: ABC transporter ATP-binding protein, partial [Cyclobacteriaceae bacterium]|nr:ABC transporter ATP-binding protein [Cyclobacteriaceae bacterium]